MKYKLKDFVTDEMLITAGYEVRSGVKKNTYSAYKLLELEDIELYIPLFDSIYGKRIIQYAPYRNDDVPLQEHIQDLIDLNYVEVVE